MITEKSQLPQFPDPKHPSRQGLKMDLPLPRIGDTSDFSNNGNDGIPFGPEWVDGEHGPALSFDGDYVNIGNPDNLYILGDITIIVRAKFNSVTELQTLVARGAAGTGESINFSYQVLLSATNRMQFFSENTGGSENVINDVSSGISIGEWVTLAFVRYNDGTAIKFYQNGKQIGSDATGLTRPTGGTSASVRVLVGNGDVGGSLPLNGDVEYAHIYDQALTAQQVAEATFNPWQAWEKDDLALWVAAQGGAPPTPTIATQYYNKFLQRTA